MATPHMAAAAAYVKMKHPDYNQRDVYAAFKDNAVDLGNLERIQSLDMDMYIWKNITQMKQQNLKTEKNTRQSQPRHK